MSGANTKDSKINRLLNRQIEADRVASERYYNVEKVFLDIIEKQEKTIAQLTATNTLFATTAHNLEAENAGLRKYLGSVLFKRRRLESASDVDNRIPTLEPRWGNR